MPTFYLNSYGPLVMTRAGREACEKHKIPPFVDGSIRREPDFQHRYPGISCLCRPQFASRLRVGDVVAYVTTKRRYLGYREAQRRLTAVLCVIATCPTHEEAARWYQSRGFRLPSNCMVPRNRAKPLDQSHQRHGFASCGGVREQWDGAYRQRAAQCSVFAICKPLFRCLDLKAPVVDDEVLINVFGRLPGTQTPGALCMTYGETLMRRLGLKIPAATIREINGKSGAARFKKVVPQAVRARWLEAPHITLHLTRLGQIRRGVSFGESNPLGATSRTASRHIPGNVH